MKHLHPAFAFTYADVKKSTSATSLVLPDLSKSKQTYYLSASIVYKLWKQL